MKTSYCGQVCVDKSILVRFWTSKTETFYDALMSTLSYFFFAISCHLADPALSEDDNQQESRAEKGQKLRRKNKKK